MKKIAGVHPAPQGHWVGDGFPVRSLFSYNGLGQQLSPFLMLDYAAPTRFEPASKPRGVGEHPHRGFETVTIVYQGEVEHRDSTGAGGTIGPGDVQWMTAASGLMHDEFHSQAFTKAGGMMEMVQLWVNLPAKDKSAPPGYQTLMSREIPVVSLPDGAGNARVIAGELLGHRGPAKTFTPIDVWDVRLSAGKRVVFDVREGHTLAVVVLKGGPVLVNDTQLAREMQLVRFDRGGTSFAIEASGDAVVLVLAGEPIDEPIVGYGPFVMNSMEEIREAISDVQSGKFGRIER